MKQKYANRNTALHIDITKTAYKTQDELNSLYSKLMDIANDRIQKVDFGAIVLICLSEDAKDGIVNGMPAISYHPDCNPGLKELHQSMWKIESKRITPIFREYL